MLCSRCKKRQAVVFVTRMEGDKTYNDGLCLVCAKELGIKPVSDMMEKFGITDDDVEQMDEQLGELMNLSGGEEEGEEGFAPGGAATLSCRICSGRSRAKQPVTLPLGKQRTRRASRIRRRGDGRKSAKRWPSTVRISLLGRGMDRSTASWDGIGKSTV